MLKSILNISSLQYHSGLVITRTLRHFKKHARYFEYQNGCEHSPLNFSENLVGIKQLTEITSTSMGTNL